MKADAVRSSTAGYCMETGALQYRHRPFRNNQDRNHIVKSQHMAAGRTVGTPGYEILVFRYAQDTDIQKTACHCAEQSVKY